jgi:hypothetical protein
MYHKYLNDKSFFLFLFKTDQDLAEQTKKQGCPFCVSVLHVANYMRKPRGCNDLSDNLSLCFSFSCSRDGCRKRSKAKSVRFLGRFVYWSVHVVLISAMLNARSSDMNRISNEFHIDIKTIKRWRRWWQEYFPTTKFWKNLRGGFLEHIEQFPVDLLTLFEINCSNEYPITTFLHSLTNFREQIN